MREIEKQNISYYQMKRKFLPRTVGLTDVIPSVCHHGQRISLGRVNCFCIAKSTFHFHLPLCIQFSNKRRALPVDQSSRRPLSPDRDGTNEWKTSQSQCWWKREGTSPTLLVWRNDFYLFLRWDYSRKVNSCRADDTTGIISIVNNFRQRRQRSKTRVSFGEKQQWYSWLRSSHWAESLCVWNVYRLSALKLGYNRFWRRLLNTSKRR